MAKRFSTALSSFIATKGSINAALDNGVLILFDGIQPTTADKAFNSSNGTAIMAITDTGGVPTGFVDPMFSIECTTSGTDSLSSLTFSGIELLQTSVANSGSSSSFATNLITTVNSNTKSPLGFYASLKTGSTTVVNIFAKKNTQDSLNAIDTCVLTRTGTLGIKVNNVALTFPDSVDTKETLTNVFTNVSGYALSGVSGINLLNMIPMSTASIDKETSVWSGLAGTDKMNTTLAYYISKNASSGFSGFTTGNKTATWFRYYASTDDPELGGVPTEDTKYIRYDGNIGTTAVYDMISSGGTTISHNTMHSVAAFSFSVPETQ